MRLNAGVCEVSGVALDPEAFGVDRVTNEIVSGVSGEYRNSLTLIMHPRLLNYYKSVDTTRIINSKHPLNLHIYTF